MDRFTAPLANTSADTHRPASVNRENVGNFNLRRAVIKFAKKKLASSDTTGMISANHRTKVRDLACRPVKVLKKLIRRLTVLKQTRTAVCRRLRQKSLTLTQLKTKAPAVQLTAFAKLNSDGDRIPDLQTLEQAHAFTKASDNIEFVLSKVKFHKKCETMLNERSKILLQLKKTPDAPELHEQKAGLDKDLGNFHHELNTVLLSGFTNRAIHLLEHQSQDEPTKRHLIKLLNGEDEFANLSADEFTRELTQFQEQIAATRPKKKAPTAATAQRLTDGLDGKRKAPLLQVIINLFVALRNVIAGSPFFIQCFGQRGSQATDLPGHGQTNSSQHLTAPL